MQGNYLENNEFPKKLERIRAAFRKHDQELEKISKDAYHSSFFEGIVSAFSFQPKGKTLIDLYDEHLNATFNRLSDTLVKELGAGNEGIYQVWQEVGSYLRKSMDNSDVGRPEPQGQFAEQVAREHEKGRGKRDSSNVA